MRQGAGAPDKKLDEPRKRRCRAGLEERVLGRPLQGDYHAWGCSLRAYAIPLRSVPNAISVGGSVLAGGRFGWIADFGSMGKLRVSMCISALNNCSNLNGHRTRLSKQVSSPSGQYRCPIFAPFALGRVPIFRIGSPLFRYCGRSWFFGQTQTLSGSVRVCPVSSWAGQVSKSTQRKPMSRRNIRRILLLPFRWLS